MTALERATLKIIRTARARLGPGFGSQKFGLRMALDEILPIVDPDLTSDTGKQIMQELAELDAKLAED